MTREEIKQVLPHREPMLLLDEAYKNEDGTSTGKYTVRGDEFFLQGHFPGKRGFYSGSALHGPVYPAGHTPDV